LKTLPTPRTSCKRAKATVPSRNCRPRRAQASIAVAFARSRAARLSCQNQAIPAARISNPSAVQPNCIDGFPNGVCEAVSRDGYDTTSKRHTNLRIYVTMQPVTRVSPDGASFVPWPGIDTVLLDMDGTL